MFELIFTTIVLVNGQIGFDQVSLAKFNGKESCTSVLVIAQQELLKTAKASGTVPGILQCRELT